MPTRRLPLRRSKGFETEQKLSCSPKLPRPKTARSMQEHFHSKTRTETEREEERKEERHVNRSINIPWCFIASLWLSAASGICNCISPHEKSTVEERGKEAKIPLKLYAAVFQSGYPRASENRRKENPHLVRHCMIQKITRGSKNKKKRVEHAASRRPARSPVVED